MKKPSPGFWVWAFLATLIGGASLLRLRAQDPVPSMEPARQSDLPVLAKVPDFNLTERSGLPVTLAQLKGRVWVADFIYTNCPSICPVMTMKMARLQESFRQEAGLSFVSLSVDPVRDTPARLKTYASIYTRETRNWLFLTGDKKAIYRLCKDGFKLTALDRPPSQVTPGEDPLVHSERFVLVDGEAQIRGYYSATEPGSLEQLKEDINHLFKSSLNRRSAEKTIGNKSKS